MTDGASLLIRRNNNYIASFFHFANERVDSWCNDAVVIGHQNP